MGKLWTKEEEDMLRELYGKYPRKYVSEKMGRSLDSLQKKAKKLGIPGTSVTGINLLENKVDKKETNEVKVQIVSKPVQKKEQVQHKVVPKSKTSSKKEKPVSVKTTLPSREGKKFHIVEKAYIESLMNRGLVAKEIAVKIARSVNATKYLMSIIEDEWMHGRKRYDF